MNATFTTREREIIRLMAERNLSCKELASELHLSPDTVKAHEANIYNKLRDQLHKSDVNRIDVVIFAMLWGYADTGKLREKYALTDERMMAAASL